MDDFLFVGRTKTDHAVYMSELSTETLQENGLSGDRGALYLYEEVDNAADNGIRVLASVSDLCAAYRLLDFLGIQETRIS